MNDGRSQSRKNAPPARPGPQLRLCSILAIIQSSLGGHSTYQYAELYRVQVVPPGACSQHACSNHRINDVIKYIRGAQTLGWGMEARARFSSVRLPSVQVLSHSATCCSPPQHATRQAWSY